MSDARESRQTTPFPAEGTAPVAAAAAVDPLAGDWSEGLRGPTRALGIPAPRLLVPDGQPMPAPVARPPPAPVAPVADDVVALEGWSATTEDPLQSAPPPVSEPPSVIITFSEPEPSPTTPQAAFLPDVTPSTPAPAFLPDVTPTTPAPEFLPDVIPPPPALSLSFLPDVTPAMPAPAFLPDVTPATAAPALPPDVTPATAAPAFPPDVTPATPAPALPPDATPGAAAPTLPPDVIPPPPALSLSFLPDVTPATPAPAFFADEGVVELRAEDAAEAATPGKAPAVDSDPWASAAAPPAVGAGPTPWSEPVAAAPPPAVDDPWAAPNPIAVPEAAAAGPWDQVTAAHAVAPAWQVPAVTPQPVEAAKEPAAEDVWSAPPPSADPVEWKPETPSTDWEEVKKPQAPVLEAPPAADWGTLSRGPDWSSPPKVDGAPADEVWGSAPPPPAASVWDAPAAPAQASAWEAAAPAAVEPEWSAPAAPPAAAPSWNAPAVGATALEQLDSEPPDLTPEPGAAQDLFGSVPMGASLSGDDEMMPPEEELGPPEELASPEDVLKPVEADEDPDLLVAIDEDAPPPPRRPQMQQLAMMQPVAVVGALEIQGEHRVAVHTRGGRTRRGTVKDVDLGKSQFALIPQGGGAAEPVYHAEVKAIFFMLAPGEKPKAADGGKVRVTFADGRTIEGSRDGGEAKHGFFLIPSDAARTNTRRIYVAREATTDIRDG